MTEQTGVPGWGNSEGVATNFTFSAGQGFWVQTSLGSNSQPPCITLAGEVLNLGTAVQYYTYELERNKKDLVANPFAGIATDLNDILVYRNSTGVTGDGSTAVWIWNGASKAYSSKYKYWADPYTDNTMTAKVGHPAWGDTQQVVVDVQINAGDAFWVQTSLGSNSDRPMLRFQNPFFDAE